MEDALYEKEKTLIFDLEVMPRLTLNYGKGWKPFEIEVLEPEYIFSVSWMWLKDYKPGKIHHRSIYDYGKVTNRNFELKKAALIQEIHQLFDEATVAGGHNSDNFDIKVSQTEFLRLDMKPPSPFNTFDTLKIGRSIMHIPSFKLDDLAKALGVDGKATERAVDLMKYIYNAQRDGDIKTVEKLLKRLKRYNNQDVKVVYDCYKKLEPWKSNTPMQYTGGYTCRSLNCSGKLIKDGFQNNKPKTTAYQRWRCSLCGKRYHDISAIKKDEYDKPMVK